MNKKWQKLEKIYNKKMLNFFYQIAIYILQYLSLGLHKGRPSYRRSLQPVKKNIQHEIREISKFQVMKFLNFLLLLWVIFVLRDTDPDFECHGTDPDPLT